MEKFGTNQDPNSNGIEKTMNTINIDQITEFCTNWLESWTGNNPANLFSFYSTDAYYQDPANPNGLRGSEEIYPYFEKLLARNPTWKWTVEEIFPTEKGFILKWKAILPVGRITITEYGMDIVELKDNKIVRNEVYFDPTKFLTLSKQESSRA